MDITQEQIESPGSSVTWMVELTAGALVEKKAGKMAETMDAMLAERMVDKKAAMSVVAKVAVSGAPTALMKVVPMVGAKADD